MDFGSKQPKMIAAPKSEEQEILDSLLAAYPDFICDDLDWAPGPNPPDFIGTSARCERFGLELTEWLHPDQTTRSIAHQDSQIALLQKIDSEHSARPSPLTRVLICDRLDIPFRRRDEDQFVREIYRFATEGAREWKKNQMFEMWNISDLSAFPTLARYCHCIVLYGPPRFAGKVGDF